MRTIKKCFINRILNLARYRKSAYANSFDAFALIKIVIGIDFKDFTPYYIAYRNNSYKAYRNTVNSMLNLIY